MLVTVELNITANTSDRTNTTVINQRTASRCVSVQNSQTGNNQL